jgi:copper chaperone
VRTTQIDLVVTGMDCAGCAQRAAIAARRIPGVLEANADHRTGRIHLAYDPDQADRAVIAQRLAAAGFTPLEAGKRR